MPTGYLVCARADSLRVVPGSIFDRICTTCGEKVMIAPSGQARLKEIPELEILCGVCLDSSHRPEEFQIGLAASVEQIANEVRTSGPNPRSGK